MHGDRDDGSDDAATAMVITGERTVPGIWHENYWFRRHELVYEHVATMVGGLDVLEAGCGEGYGAALLARVANRVDALDYDSYAVEHVRRTYPQLPVARANLVRLPVADHAYDVVVSLQTIEHLWDQEAFVAECVRVLRPGGLLVISTPNRLTFPSGNLYHPHELTGDELHALVSARAAVESMVGLRHGPRIASWEATYGSIVDAQVADPYERWARPLREEVEHVGTADFVLSPRGIDTSLDLVVRARTACPHGSTALTGRCTPLDRVNPPNRGGTATGG